MTTIACTLRTGGDFEPRHVFALCRGVRDHLSDRFRFMCFSDARASGETIMRGATVEWVPLQHDWPGAWAKMELCRPDVKGPMLFIDLDTVIVGDIAPLAEEHGTSIVLRAFFRGRRDKTAVQSSMMYLTESDRALVWGEFNRDRQYHFRTSKHWDQGVYELVLRDRALRWQDTHPGMVVGYKTDLARGKKVPPPDARVVIFHGQPRPWESGHPWAEEPFAT